MCGANRVSLSDHETRQAASHKLRGIGTQHIIFLTALTSAGCTALAAATLALWTSLGCWACCIGAWLLVEAAFYLLQCWRYSYASRAAVENAHVDPAFRAVMEDRLLELGSHFGIEDFFSGWFRDAPFESIRKGNVEDFIAYGFCAKAADALSAEDRQRGQALIRRIEETFHMRFEAGRNPDIRFMAHLWEPLRWIHSPLAVYMAAEGLWMASSLLLRALGFRPFKHPSGIKYWIWSPLTVREAAAKAVATTRSISRATSSELVFRHGAPLSSGNPPCPPSVFLPLALAPDGVNAHADESSRDHASVLRQLLRHIMRRPSLDFRIWNKAQSLRMPTAGKSLPRNCPIVFLHGVGLGLMPYLQLIHELTCAFRTRPIVLLEGRHVSVCLSRQSLCSDDMAMAVRDILQQHGWAQAAFIGHSYGTFVLSRIAQIYKPIVQSMVLIDPVCLLTIYPQLLRNFLYKVPMLLSFSSLLGVVDWMRYIFSRDLLIAESFCRKLVWHRECLWPQDLPQHCLLVLEAEDDLVPSKLARTMLHKMKHPCDVLFHPTAGHGGFILDTQWRSEILAQIHTVIIAGANAACNLK